MDLDIDFEIPGGDGCGPAVGAVILIAFLAALVSSLLAHWMFLLALVFLAAAFLAVHFDRKRRTLALDLLVASCLIGCFGFGAWGVARELEAASARAALEELQRQADEQREAEREAEQKRIGAVGRFKLWALGSEPAPVESGQ